MTDRFASMQRLLQELPAAENYSIQVNASRRSRVKLFAPHGGCIEPCTGPIVAALADAGFDSYIFQGVRRKDCYRTLHVTSVHYDEPACLELVATSELAVAIHGCDGEEAFIEVGGGNTAFRELLERRLNAQGYKLRRPPAARGGEDPANFVNRARQRGIQLELSAGFRRMLFPGFPRVVTRHPEHFPAFLDTMWKWLAEVEQQLGPSHA